MRKVTLVLLASVLCLSIFLAPVTGTAAEGIGSGLVLKAGFGCVMQQGKLVCGKTKKSDDNDDDDDGGDDDKPKKNKATGNKCAGDNDCGAGYTDLETPNKYGACCEAAEASKTAPQEAEKCKFPGEIGTPPNCQCPDGTEFRGYKGCLKYKQATWCEKAYVASVMNSILSEKCREEYSHGSPECHKSDDPLYLECCCHYRDFQ
jgi:hypothetical protein